MIRDFGTAPSSFRAIGRASERAARAAIRTLSARGLRRLACALMVVAGVVQAAQTTMALLGDRRLVFTNWDFPAFYAAGRLVASGDGSRLYDLEAIRLAELQAVGHPVGGSGVLPFFNPAFFALPFVPLSRLDLQVAYQAWALISIALIVVDVLMILMLTRHLPRRWRFACVAAFVTLIPVSYGLQHGQFSLILLTSWGAAFLLLRANRDRWAGVALAPLLIKPELVLPVAAYLLWKRRFAVFQTLVPLTVLAVLMSVLVTGVPAALGYPGFLLESTRWEGQGVTTAVMFGWNGIVATFISDPSSPATRAAVAVLVLLTVVAVRAALRSRVESVGPSFATHWLLLTVATVLVDLHFYLQDTILLALPAVALIAAVPVEHRPALAAAGVVGWLLLALGNAPSLYLGVNIFAFYMLGAGAIVVWMSVRSDARQPQRRAAMAVARVGF